MKSNTAGRGRRLMGALGVFLRQERGAGTAFYVLGTMALLVTAAFIVDSSVTTGDAAQIKRATDAAALAVGHQAVASNERNQDFDQEQINALAYEYVRANLGINDKLAQEFSPDKVSVSAGRSGDNYPTYTVTATFATDPELLDLNGREQQIHSTVEVRTASLEVALAMPNAYTASNGAGNLAALRNFGRYLADLLIEESDNVWLALVPYAGSVSVYDERRPALIRQWASSEGINPPGLAVVEPSISSNILADGRIPDRRANLLCLYRGMDVGENYFWEQAPTGRFMVSFQLRAEVDNPYSVLVGSNRPVNSYIQYSRGQVIDQGDRMRTSPDCPVAPLLPLSNDIEAIQSRLDEMRLPGSSSNSFDLALGWSAMALAPAFRGSEGWDLDDDLPKDFSEDGVRRTKAIVMLINGSFTSFGSTSAEVTPRLNALCSSFRRRDLKVYLIVVNPSEAFNLVAKPGLETCSENSSDQTYLTDVDFAGGESDIQERLEEIADELFQQSSLVRLIE
ncbi:TadE/TadG family type IV pilus assembly protein [Brenneria tiliae]|uniref:Pilus assembly protein n=1 Tax=Brenneria tiliae TaxID=2914984 RepID=A0ABT0MTR3_9GAMM|nr:pilus assembly protein [Brenneria tiliae]MCL2893172.1 pilus assembly protein [Brenneria tiliae]